MSDHPGNTATLTFADLGIPSDILNALAVRGLEAPFPIQSLTIPDGLAGRDVCGQAKTGSGKTLAFGIPIVARAARAQPRKPTEIGRAHV